MAEWVLPEEGQGAWLVEVKNTQDPIGQGKVEYFCKQVELVKQEKAYTEVIAWYMSRQGFTAEATTTLEQRGVLYLGGVAVVATVGSTVIAPCS